MTQKRILVTGTSGFIGSNLYEYLKNTPTDDIYAFTARQSFYYLDVTDEDSIRKFYKTFDPTHIVHLAAMASFRQDDPTDIIDVNIKGTLNLLNCLTKPVDFIFSSSIFVYGSNENCFYETDKCNPTSIYGASKLACEHLLNIYFRQGKVRPRILRLCGNVGPNMTHGRLHQAINGQDSFKLHGKAPWSYVPYCHISDTIKAITTAIEYNKPSLTVNVTPSDTLSLQTAFNLIENKLGRKINLTSEGTEEPEHICCHNIKANYELNWKQSYSSMDALKTALDEIIKN